ncbi:MAG: 2,5-diamino-6-(ribosylamino)-4(3H)-pyrimidinone 5'-phosphate reductase [Planctomycetota bacterium]|nr:MAG: 2,5-diamino-6-(ribosylamino)-4(3H)-pyrimidinone 5'-phosphate reductase [Planctomycetota bacterium]
MQGLPYVLYNVGMSLDGKIALETYTPSFSSPQDWQEVHQLRASVDAIMVGIRTVLRDDPALTVRHVPPPLVPPAKVVVDSQARMPLGAKVLQGSAKCFVATTSSASLANIQKLQRASAQVIVCGESWVDLPRLLKILHSDWNIHKILLEGGGTLAYSMLCHRLVHEIRVAISPVIVGSRGGIALAEGKIVPSLEQAIQLQLIEHYPLGDVFILRYKVKYS